MNARILLFLLTMACDEPGEDTSTATEEAPEGCLDHTWTCAELEAAIAAAYGDAELECTDGDETFIISASGVPLYDSTQTTPNEITAQDYRIEIPLTAVCADEAVDVTDSRGSIAISIAGLAIFGASDVNGNDAIEFEGPTMDECWGHAAPDGAYHHHSEPVCVFGTDTDPSEHPMDDGHPPLIALSYDGFGIYAINDDDPEGSELDQCSGQTDPERGYHYHMTETYPYTFGCYAGER